MVRKGYLTVEKGSVTVNGVSLTVCDSEKDRFRGYYPVHSGAY